MPATPIQNLSDAEWLALVQRAITMPDAPPQLVQHALELWRSQPAPPRTQALLKRWVAVLSFDSWAAAPVAAGMRALPSEVRQMLFATEVGDIDLRIAPLADGFALSGQLLGLDGEGSVELTALRPARPAPLQHRVAIDASSEFRFDGVASGTYLMTVHMDLHDIVLPPIDVGPAPGAGVP